MQRICLDKDLKYCISCDSLISLISNLGHLKVLTWLPNSMYLSMVVPIP